MRKLTALRGPCIHPNDCSRPAPAALGRPSTYGCDTSPLKPASRCLPAISDKSSLFSPPRPRLSPSQRPLPSLPTTVSNVPGSTASGTCGRCRATRLGAWEAPLLPTPPQRTPTIPVSPKWPGPTTPVLKTPIKNVRSYRHAPLSFINQILSAPLHLAPTPVPLYPNGHRAPESRHTAAHSKTAAHSSGPASGTARRAWPPSPLVRCRKAGEARAQRAAPPPDPSGDARPPGQRRPGRGRRPAPPPREPRWRGRRASAAAARPAAP
jgi:hypothetical protein